MRIHLCCRPVAVIALLGLLLSSPLPAQNFRSAQPAERIEYWQKRLQQIDARLARTEPLDSVRVLFLGDSITDFWTMDANPWFPGKSGGLAVWNESFGPDSPYPALNFGISGDRTEHLLYRIQPKSAGGLGQLDRPDLNPEVIVLLIGINNSWDAESPAVDSMVAGIEAVVAAVHSRKPNARILLQSLLPTSEAGRNQTVVRPVNAALADFASTHRDTVQYLDLYPAFLSPDGRQNPALYMDDVHPNDQGYRVWQGLLLPVLDQMQSRDTE